MAKPIQETPVLFGKDAKKFIEAIKAPIKISTKKRAEVKVNYLALKSIAKF